MVSREQESGRTVVLDVLGSIEEVLSSEGRGIILAKHHRRHGEGSIFKRKDGHWVVELLGGYDEAGKRSRPTRMKGGRIDGA